MKVYTRLTPRDWHEAKVKYSTPQAQRIILKKCWDLENVIESGELYDCEEVRKETAREILQMLIGHEMRDKGAHMAWVIVKQDVEFIAEKYGIELFGKTEPFGNSDRLEDEE